jgi:transposase-like protein
MGISMAIDTFSHARFTCDVAAREYLESLRWPDGPVCPHCGTIGHAYAIKPHGTYRCAESACRGNFTVTMNSPMERSHIALHKWVQAFHLMCASKKGISAHQLHRMLNIAYKSAWFMAHRIRECMRDGGLAPLGGGGQVVEADETYFGNTETKVMGKGRKGRPYTKGGKSGPAGKRAVVSLVERGGRVRSFHPAVADSPSVTAIVRENIAREAQLMTDESRLYMSVGFEFASHHTVTHSHGEYVRTETKLVDGQPFVMRKVHTNTVEGYFSIFKRGMKGIYQHCKEKHLHRYLAEFDFRYNHRIRLGFTDGERAALAVKNATGKRLTYQQRH